MVAHPGGRSLLLFGGYYDTGAEMRYYNDVWELTLETMVWKVRVGVGPATHRSPRHLTRFEPLFLELNGISVTWRAMSTRP